MFSFSHSNAFIQSKVGHAVADKCDWNQYNFFHIYFECLYFPKLININPVSIILKLVFLPGQQNNESG